MRTTLALDDELLAKAQGLTGLTEKSAIVREGLKALIERESARRLALLGVSEHEIVSPLRRRPEPARSWWIRLSGLTTFWVQRRLSRNCFRRAVCWYTPFVIGEVGLGKLRQRTAILGYLWDLPQARVATDLEVFSFIEQRELSGSGIGYVDAHLLASTRLTPGASLWTRDQGLVRVAEQMGLASRF